MHTKSGEYWHEHVARRTDYEDKTSRLAASPPKPSHAMDDRACEIAIKHSADVNKMEDQSNQKESKYRLLARSHLTWHGFRASRSAAKPPREIRREEGGKDFE